MLTYQDCLELSGLTEEEIMAVAEHEHIPAIVALELAQYLVQMADGSTRLRRIIVDDIAREQATGHPERAERLQLVLKHFLATHPERDNAP